MKVHLACVSTTLLFASLSFPASAHLQNDNPRASIAFVGPHAITGLAGSTVPGMFKVRVIDTQGAPMAGLKVWFYNNQAVGFPEDPPPPPISFGSFQGPEDPLGVITDANGVATSPAYRIGYGPYDVVAGVYGVAGPENAAIGFPPLVALFHLNYVPTEPPPPLPPPQGTAVPVMVPAASTPTLVILALAGGILALLRLRKFGLAGRRRR